MSKTNKNEALSKKVCDLRSLVIFERATGRPSEYLPRPSFTPKEKEEIKRDFEKSIKDFKDLRYGDKEVYETTITHYKKMIDYLNI